MQRHCIEIGLIELEAEASVEGIGADSLRIACQMQFRAAKTPCLIYKSQHQRLAVSLSATGLFHYDGLHASDGEFGSMAVSYTHLKLPTICSV